MTNTEHQAAFVAADSFAVLFGTSLYQGGFDNIPGVEGNLRELRKRLIDASLFGLDDSNIATIHNDGDIIRVRRVIAEKAKLATSLFLLYYSGHGATRADNLYLTLPPTTASDAEQSGLNWSDIRQTIQESPARTKLIILDCCYSGRALKGILSDPSEWLDQQLQRDESGQLIDPKGFVAIASAPATSVSYGLEDREFTEFTGELLGVLDSGVDGAGAFLSMEDIFTRLSSTIIAKRLDDSTVRLPKPQLVSSGLAAKAKLVRNRRADPDVLRETYEVQIRTLRTEVEKLRSQNIDLRDALSSASHRTAVPTTSALERLSEWSTTARELREAAANVIATEELSRLDAGWLQSVDDLRRDIDILFEEFGKLFQTGDITLADRRLVSELQARNELLAEFASKYRDPDVIRDVRRSNLVIEPIRDVRSTAFGRLMLGAYVSTVLVSVALVCYFVGDNLGLGVSGSRAAAWIIGAVVLAGWIWFGFVVLLRRHRWLTGRVARGLFR